MTLPLWCTGRPLGTWRGTSSSAGTSRRCAVGFSWISPHKEREAWKRRNLEGWQEGHAVATTVPFICRCVPGCHGTWADGQRKKKMSLNFCTRQFRAQRDRCYYQGGDFSPFNIVDAQHWPGLSVTWRLLQGGRSLVLPRELELPGLSVLAWHWVHVGPGFWEVLLSKMCNMRRCSCFLFSRLYLLQCVFINS